MVLSLLTDLLSALRIIVIDDGVLSLRIGVADMLLEFGVITDASVTGSVVTDGAAVDDVGAGVLTGVGPGVNVASGEGCSISDILGCLN